MIEFKNYFKEKFYAERAYEKFQEMASPGVGENKGDVVRRPIHLDKEDINFLNQFPKDLWGAALSQRYEMLHDELSNLHKKRMGMGFKKLESKLKAAMEESFRGNPSAWDDVKDDLSPETLQRLKRFFSKEKANELTSKELKKIIEDEADKEAYEEIKAKTDNIEESPEPIDFKFGKKIIVAHPYLNRLYHKIERTRGLEHHSTSGLKDFEKSHGEYGYDLAHPLVHDFEGEKKRTTRGSGSWPDKNKSEKVIRNLINLNQHGVFGDLEIPEDAEWRPVVDIKTHKPIKDHWTLEKQERKHFKKIYRELTTSGKYAKENEKRNDADRMAKEATMKDAEEGRLLSPAIPLKNPDGSPVTSASGEPLSPDSRKFRVEDGKIIMPDVYLPHVPKKFVTKDNKGKRVEQDHWVPIVNPAHAFREVGDEESDYEKDETGTRTGRFNWDSLKDKLTGIPDEEGNKRYVKVNADEYHKSGDKGHQAPAAFHLNHNSKGKYFISRADPKYEDLYKKIFGGSKNGGMNLVKDKVSGADVYDDFRTGIIRCTGGSKCGGAGSSERSAIRQNISSIHGIIVTHALDNLGNPKLLTSKGRIDYADAFVGTFAQTNLGAGTRRRRILDAKIKDISRHTTGAEGGEIGDSVDDSAVDRISKMGAAEIGRGKRKLPTIDWLTSGSSAYNVDAYRKLLTQIQKDAEEADKKEKESKLDPSDIEKISSSILDRAEVITTIKELLKKVYSKSRGEEGDEGLDKDIDDEIKGWIDDGANDAAKLVDRFKNHPLVMQHFGNNKDTQPDKAVEKAQEKAPEQFGASHANISLQKDEIDIINKLKNSPEFKSIQSLYGTAAWEEGKKALLATAGNKYSTFVSKWAERKIQSGEIEINPNSEERILVAMQHFLDNQFNLSSIAKVSPDGKSVEGNPLQKLMAARKISKEPSKPEVPVAAIPQPGRTKSSIYDPSSRDEDFYFLASAQRWIDLIKHPDFETEKLPPRYYNSLAGMVARWFQNKWISQEEYQELESRIKRKL
jgi:hypothetical protein